MLENVSSPSRSTRPESKSASTSDSPSCAELNALQARDPQVIEQRVYGNGKIVYGMLLKMVKNANVAEELLQETFYQAIRSIENFRGDAKVSTWLCSIARNLAYRYFRTQSRYTTVESNTLERMSHSDFLSDSASEFDNDPRRHTERRERKALVHAAMEELPASYREIIQLRDLEQKSTKEVAQELGLTRVNVRVRLHRARKRLESVLRSHLDEDRWAKAA